MQAELTIAAGTILTAVNDATEPTYLLVTTDGELDADGTPEAPVVFRHDSGNPGRWGGLVLFGSAPSTADGVPEIEGASFGGANVEHSCGTLRHVLVQHTGGEYDTPDSRSAGVVLAGCGTSTIVDGAHVADTSGDGLLIVGGTAPLKRLAATGVGGDGVSIREGFSGSVQFVLAELDGRNGTGLRLAGPMFGSRPHASVWNVTTIGGDSGTTAVGVVGYAPVHFGNVLVSRKGPINFDVCYSYTSGFEAAVGDGLLRGHRLLALDCEQDIHSDADDLPSPFDNELMFGDPMLDSSYVPPEEVPWTYERGADATPIDPELHATAPPEMESAQYMGAFEPGVSPSWLGSWSPAAP